MNMPALRNFFLTLAWLLTVLTAGSHALAANANPQAAPPTQKQTDLGLGNANCPQDCSGRGECRASGCKCLNGYTGMGCEIKIVKPAKSGRHSPKNNKSGNAIGIGKNVCPKDCNGNGQCIATGCACKSGYTGLDCGEEVPKPPPAKASAPTHSKTFGLGNKECPNDCSDKGVCTANGCHCNEGYTGLDCSEENPENPGMRKQSPSPQLFHKEKCPDNCNNQGECTPHGCACKQGFTGLTCDQKIPMAP